MLCIISRAVLIAAVLAVPLAAHETAAQANTRVVVSPASALVGEGQTTAVEVRVENVQNLYGLDIRIAFDPAVVEVVDADTTQTGIQVRPGDLLSVDFIIRNTADNAQGTIWYALTQLNPSEPVSGSGTVFIILFKGKTRGASTALSITYQKMSTQAGEVIHAGVVNGEIRVVEPEHAPPTPTPAPPPPQPTVQMVTAEPTPAPPTTQPAVTATAPAPTASPSATGTQPAFTSTALPPASTQPARTAEPAASPTAHTGATPAPQPTAPSAEPLSGGGMNVALVLAGMGAVLVLFYVGWLVRKRGSGR